MKLAYRVASVCLGICGLAIVGCAADETPEAEGNQSTFTCPTGESIEAVFPSEVDGEVMVTLPDQETVSLPRVESASGAKYSDGTTTFWEKGGEALVEQNGEVVLQGCTAE